MEISPKNQDSDDELLSFLEGLCNIASLTSTCQEADFSGTSPSECRQGSAQWWAYLFGSIVAWYVLKDKEWRLNLFNEGEFIIDGKPTNIWVWDDIWGDSDEKGAPDRKVPLVVGSLLSDYDDSRDWKALREHYLCMWSGSYTSYGKPLSEVGPEDDLYWAMRIGFADKMLEQQKPVEEQVDSRREITMIKDTLTSMSLRQVKEEHEDHARWEKLFEELRPTTQKIRLRLEQQLGIALRVLPKDAVSHSVQAEQYYQNGLQAPAILAFANAVSTCLKYCFVNPLINYLQKHREKQVTIRFSRGAETKSVAMLGELSLGEWADILDMLAAPRSKGLAELGIASIRRFTEEYLGGQRLPDFRPLSESLHKINKYRNHAAHFSPEWENPTQDLEQTRSIVLGTEGKASVIVQISQLLAPRKSPNSALPPS